MSRVIFSVVLAVALLASPLSSFAQTTGCQYILGFQTLHDLDPTDVGACTDNQAFAANGDAQQHTNKGLMAWRKLDNWTAFTNGYWTWINGPGGLKKRLNTQRFLWEANPDHLPLAQELKNIAPWYQEPPKVEGTPCIVPVSDPNGPERLAKLVYPNSKELLRPLNACGALSGLLSPLLQERIAVLHGFNVFCRCQGIPNIDDQFATSMTPTGAVVSVVETWDAHQHGAFDLYLVKTESAWVVSDIRCGGGGADTSIFVDHFPNCITTT